VDLARATPDGVNGTGVAQFSLTGQHVTTAGPVDDSEL